MRKSYIWREDPGTVFESSLSEASCRLSGDGEVSYDVIRSNNRRLDELYAAFYVFLPEFLNEVGIYNLLTLSRLEASREQVFLYISYQERESRFGFHMNAGNTSPELVGAATCRAHPRAVRGRVLLTYVHLSQGRLYAAVYDKASGRHLAAVGTASGSEKQPWGACPTGRWHASIGRTQVAGRRFSRLPAGVGLSDLLVAFGSHGNCEARPLEYSGALDRLQRLCSLEEIEGRLRGMPPAWAVAAPSWSSVPPSF